MVRDEELKRLIKYAQGLGIRVVFKPRNGSQDEASWSLDNTEIEIFTTKRTSKLDMILSLVHELGHAQHNIHEKDRQVDKKLEKTIDHIDELDAQGEIPAKSKRKILLEDEIAGTLYWESIYKETNLKFPKWRLQAQMEIDIAMYEVYYEEALFPRGKRKKDLIRKIKEKHRREV